MLAVACASCLARLGNAGPLVKIRTFSSIDSEQRAQRLLNSCTYENQGQRGICCGGQCQIETTLNARDYAGTRRACGMGHVASGETRRQCSAEESADIQHLPKRTRLGTLKDRASNP